MYIIVLKETNKRRARAFGLYQDEAAANKAIDGLPASMEKIIEEMMILEVESAGSLIKAK